MTRLVWLRLAVIAGLVIALEIACRAGLIRDRVLIPPSAMAVSMIEQLAKAETLRDIGETLGNILLAFATAVVSGFAAGVVIHALPRVRRGLEPFFATYYAVPLFIFYPVLIGIFGVSRMPIVLMGFAFSVIAVVISTLNALDREPRVLVKLTRVHRMHPLRAAIFVKLPAAAPHLFVGIKLAVAYSFIAVIACEFLLSASGIGHAIAFAYNAFDNETMYGLILLVIVLVTLVNAALGACGDHLMRRHGSGTRGVGIGQAEAGGGAVALAVDALVIIAVLIAGWEILSLWVGKNALSSPARTLALMVEMTGQRRFWLNVGTSLEAFGIALAISYGSGIVLGVLLGITKLGTAIAEPILVAFYSLPKIVLLPIILLTFGLGLSSKVAFGALHSIIPIALLTMGAIGNLRAIYTKLSRSLRLSSWQTIRSIALPATLPEIISGLRVGFSLTLLGVLIGEMFASKRGLGYLIMNSIGLGDTELPIALGLFLFLLAGLGNALLLYVNHRLVRRV